MKRLFALLTLVATVVSIYAQSWMDSAVCRSDNSYCTYYDTSSPRKAVPAPLLKQIRHKYMHPADSSRNQIFEVRVNGETNMYVVRFDSVPLFDGLFEEYHFWLYNKLTKSVSPKPFVIFGGWALDNENGFNDKLLTLPLVETADNRILLRERKHNGIYNAVMLYSILFDKSLNMQIQYLLEETSLVVMEGNKPEVLRRIWHPDSVICFSLADEEMNKIGSYTTSSENAITAISVENPIYELYIVTSSPEKSLFIKRIYDQKSQLLAVSESQSSDLRDFEGRYWLAVAVQLPLDLTFQRSGDSVVPVIYSVFQGNAAIYPTSWSFSGDTLVFRNKDISLKITAVYNRNSNTFDGTFKQFVTSERITFNPTEGPFKANRPQTPVPPYSFDQEEVTFASADGSATLSGTLSLPKTGGKFPAVVLVSGSGQQNRDEEIFMHKPFLVIADYFARRGIAVLRYDDRGVGRSTGDASKATTLDFANDARGAFDFLRKHHRIDRSRIGIVGHSEGALIAQIVAARCLKVSFIAFLGGQGCSGAEVLLQQNRRLFELQGVADTLVEKRLACMREFFVVADTIGPKGKMIPALQEVISRNCPNLTQSQLEVVGLDKKSLFGWSQQLQLPWFKTFLKLTPADYLPKVKCRILAIGGEKDVQVPAKENLEQIKKLSGGRADTRLMPSLNHLFQHCTTGLPDEYLSIEETISPEVLEILADWILEK